MTEDNKQANVLQEVAKAERELRQARLLRAADEYDGCLGHAYYSAFHYARALILMEGLEARTHSGVIHLINQHLVRTGRMSPDVACFLPMLQRERELEEYDAAAVITVTMADEALQRSHEFGQMARALLTQEGYLKIDG